MLTQRIDYGRPNMPFNVPPAMAELNPQITPTGPANAPLAAAKAVAVPNCAHEKGELLIWVLKR